MKLRLVVTQCAGYIFRQLFLRYLYIFRGMTIFKVAWNF